MTDPRRHALMLDGIQELQQTYARLQTLAALAHASPLVELMRQQASELELLAAQFDGEPATGGSPRGDFKGPWGTLEGALLQGACVKYKQEFYELLRDVADITKHIPVDGDGTWRLLKPVGDEATPVPVSIDSAPPVSLSLGKVLAAYDSDINSTLGLRQRVLRGEVSQAAYAQSRAMMRGRFARMLKGGV